MWRRLRLIVILVVGLVVAGAVVAVLTSKPDLDDARDRVDARWLVVRPSLVDRYTSLAAVEIALGAAGGPDRAVTKDLHSTLARWNRLAKSAKADADAGEEASTANELEGLARRVKANVAASGKLQASTGLTTALQAFDTAVPKPVTAVDGYNRAVRAYQDERRGFLHRIVASLFGYGSRPQLVLGA